MRAAHESLFLVGMMGTGKSTVGRLLARELGLEFVDCDKEMEARSGVSVSTVFELEGEAAFRRREAALLDELTRRAGIVLATGGGAVLLEENRTRLRERGLVIHLQATVDEILRRTQNDRSRPLLQTPDKRERVTELLEQRRPLYEATAHVSFHSGAINPKKLVARILAHETVRHALALS